MRRFLRPFVDGALALLMLCLLPQALAQTCAAPGKDGPVSGAIVNTYYPPAAVGTVAAGATSITLGTKVPASAPDIAAGDLVLVIQMQGATLNANNTDAYGNGVAGGLGQGYSGFPASGQAGLYEYRRVVAVAGATITLNAGLTNAYVQAFATATQGAQTFQVVRIPQYSALTLANTSLSVAANTAWNGQTGGIIAADVTGVMSLGGATISAAGAGFRGGAQRTDGHGGGTEYVAASNVGGANAGHGQKGEGIAGRPTELANTTTRILTAAGATSFAGYPRVGATIADGNEGRGAPATAGGGGTGAASGGGGGSNGGTGGIGGHAFNGSISPPAANNTAGQPGTIFAEASAGRMVLGSGGGAGTSNDSVGAALDGSGGVGGGMVFLRAGSFTGAATINVNGTQGPDNLRNDGAGGGGAGGSVYISAASGALTGITVVANGGRGGNNNPGAGDNPHGPGGGGGGGGGRVFASGALNAASTVAGGASGVNLVAATTTNNAWGAQPGNAGVIITGVTAPTNSASGAACKPNLTVAKSTTTPTLNVPPSTTAQYVLSVRNSTTSGVAYGVALTDILPVPFALASITTQGASGFSGAGSNGPSPNATNQSGTTTTAQFGIAGSGSGVNAFTLAPGGFATVTFTVNLNTSTVGLFQNDASVQFTDPTRSTGGAATATGAQTAVTPGGSFTDGSAVGGSNYASGSSTAEDVRIVTSANINITKTNGQPAVTAGGTTAYTITVSNTGPGNASGTVVTDPPAPGLQCTAVSCSVGSGSAVCPASVTITALQGAGLSIPSLPANSSLNFVVSCNVTATGQ